MEIGKRLEPSRSRKPFTALKGWTRKENDLNSIPLILDFQWATALDSSRAHAMRPDKWGIK
ncbi:MAG: hypothetical protein ACLFQQ_13200 [Desulfococcaceae bacterium]